MKKVIKQWLAFSLVSGVLFSCSEDRNEPNSPAEGSGETVTLSLSAEVSVDDSDLRAINYKLGINANGKVVPLPEFTDGQEVDVHTILKSNRSGYPVVAKTLKWRYNAASKSLVLSPTSKVVSQDVNNIVIANFNNDNGVKWYISGLIGGQLSGSKVTFEGTRELRGVEGNVGDIVGSLNVPYAFGWTEVTINTQDKANVREGNGSYRYAQIPSSAKVKFSPLGSLIAYKLGNDQREGAYTFTPSGFYVSSNVFFDKGTFDLNTAIPTSGNTQSVLPTWTEGALSNLVYSFARGQEPGVIDHKQVSGKTYYAWVMPNSTKPAVEVTRVTMKGESSRPETSTYRDYTKTWFTDYSVKGTQLTHGRVYSLKANATHTYRLPIEYVTDYNLAGGEGLTYTRRSDWTPPASDYDYPLPGTSGPLRFADSHSNIVSGYYDYFVLKGEYHAKHNPEGKDLQVEVDKVFGADKYFIPTLDQWWGVFPSNIQPVGGTYMGNNEMNLRGTNKDEPIAFGPGNNLFRQSYWSDYATYYDQTHHDNPRGAEVVYAIRFKARNNATPMSAVVDYDEKAGVPISYTYPSATDNSLKCAYRITRVGSARDWAFHRTYTGAGIEENRVLVDVVYLGEEIKPTELATISNPAWWAAKKAERLVISKNFPGTGELNKTSDYGSNIGGIIYSSTTGRNLISYSTTYIDIAGAEMVAYDLSTYAYVRDSASFDYWKRFQNDDLTAYSVRLFHGNP